jgi:hypothetical protein
MPTSDALPDTKLDFLGLARRRFQRASEAENGQRKAMIAAKKFRAGDQWSDEVKIQRMGGQGIQGVAAEPARPFLTIDRVSAPVRQVSNSVRAANFAIDVHPNGFGADDETARILKGLLRQIQNDARGEDPIEWAADGAAEAGLGWFRLFSDYCYNDPDLVQSDPAAIFDQDLKIGRISNSLTVYCDPSARSPTKRDAKFMHVVEDLAKAEFIRKYGAENVPSDDIYRSEGDEDSWVGDDLVRISEYWTCDYDQTTIWLSPDGVVSQGPKPEGYDKATWKTRVLHVPRVQMSKITATKVLERNDWPGTRIPIFPVLGEELNIDGKTVLRGVIEGAIDPQRMVNWLYSAAIEQIALGGKTPYIVAAGQIENYKNMWATANTKNHAYLVFDPVPGAEKPHRESIEPPIQAMVEMLGKSEEAIKATTSIYDPSLGNTNPREKSGRAIMALQQQAEHANSNYLDNVQRAMVDAGGEMIMLCPVFYDRPGRVLKIVGANEEPEQVTLGAPMPPNPMGGASPAPGSPQAPAGMAGAPLPDPRIQQQAQGMQQFYDLKKGNYSVTVDVSQSYSTKRQEGLADMQDLVKVLPPEMAMVVVPNIVKYSDFPGNQDIYDLLIKALPPQLQPTPKGQQPIPPQVQAQLGQASQMVEMLSKELNAKNQIIETEQVKAQQAMQEKQIDADTRIKVAWIQASAQLATAGMKVDAENARSYVDALEQQGAKALDAHMERLSQHADHVHEAALTAMQQAHEVATMGAQASIDQNAQRADQQHEQGMQADQHAAQADLQQQAADQQPQGAE